VKTLRVLGLALLPLALGGCAAAVINGTASGDTYEQRSGHSAEDARITREVRTLLYREPMLAEERIRVATLQGVVSLSGTISSREAMRRAVDIARSVEGVHGINLELRLEGN